ncbi:MAG: hypothetical protein JWQ35_2766 [Bacteriovoracaceae bacterium]|nr:hypothetical protein [Bacteriovoracaceae bacterium]
MKDLKKFTIKVQMNRILTVAIVVLTTLPAILKADGTRTDMGKIISQLDPELDLTSVDALESRIRDLIKRTEYNPKANRDFPLKLDGKKSSIDDVWGPVIEATYLDSYLALKDNMEALTAMQRLAQLERDRHDDAFFLLRQYNDAQIQRLSKKLTEEQNKKMEDLENRVKALEKKLEKLAPQASAESGANSIFNANTPNQKLLSGSPVCLFDGNC